MIPALTVTLFAVLALLCVVTAVYALIGRPVDNLVLGVTGLVGLVLLVQLFVGLVMVLTTEHDIPAWEFGAYLFGMVALLPVAFLWSVAERESRWGMAVLFFAGLALLVMTQRVVAIWYEIPALLSH
ncbi:hypothetical protein I6I18_02565 [Kytococcus sedentarius]|uniref:Integral membrane protein n=1 Tax=Kytococcus sedentarius (strain ATCC 14392 / DSM 20547 / JCM 11482 / CCUG 33030 / NBRC 15357 / NCTC 11040 / CCM 314 / 541) TaxID=478801 RepID=C7NG01_KYTSD|nr:hypothetical protein [Kytococcus sedentarius]OLT35358.1 hypothetical protein BJF82_00975 [Kytococcus sp. CUA-901]ACV06001.1 hypothetical protein Ksed_09550 [Kytococcus sedentarius DSM 20547]QQB64380.1 hypothetical protein I6I18_02565 [Kytococcus sedentarius]QRO88012.1 hypothetical protein I6J30_03395 [Kytococcus sedentarius]STX12580.1 Uncharacterised protein [Kytococcus sedentarius]